MIALAVAIVLAVGIGVALVVATGDDDAGAVSTRARLTAVESSCTDWMGSSGGTGPDDQWCTDMFTWMSERTDGSMMGSMMWQDRDELGRACRTWVGEDRPDTEAPARCDDMVEWMDGHMSSRDGSWMMRRD